MKTTTILRWYPLLIPFVLMLLLEGAFRLGLWEWVAKPDSHAGQVIALKSRLDQYAVRTASDPITHVALGNSTTVFGLSHPMLHGHLKSRQSHYVSAAIPGSHLTALKTRYRWLQDQLPDLETVILGINVGDTNRVFNGYYERNLVLPLCEGCSPASIVRSYPPERQKQESYGSLSHVLSYREDIGGALLHPLQRVRELLNAANRRPEVSLLYENRSTDHLCNIPLQNVEACREALGHPESIDNVHGLQTMRLYCANVSQPAVLSEPARAAQDVWIDWIASIAAQRSVQVLLMPEHPLFRAGTQSLATRLKERLGERGIDAIDLRAIVASGNDPECSYWRDLVHLNARGAGLATLEVIGVMESRDRESM